MTSVCHHRLRKCRDVDFSIKSRALILQMFDIEFDVCICIIKCFHHRLYFRISDVLRLETKTYTDLICMFSNILTCPHSLSMVNWLIL